MAGAVSSAAHTVNDRAAQAKDTILHKGGRAAGFELSCIGITLPHYLPILALPHVSLLSS